MNPPIDRTSPVPYYAQVKETLRGWIRDRRWKTGEQIPGEHELCESFDVSRPVIRQALNELVAEGLITRQKGKGTFVAEPKIKEGLVQRLTGFHHDMTRQGYQPFNRVLKQHAIPPTQMIAELLQIKPDEQVMEIERLRFIQDEPIVLVTTYLPARLCPELLTTDLTHQSLYALLEQNCGVFIASGRRTIEAVPADKYTAALLRVRKGTPLIQLDSVSYTASGSPVEYYRAYHRGDRSAFEIELVRVMEGEKISEVLTSQLPPPVTIKLPRRPDLSPEWEREPK